MPHPNVIAWGARGRRFKSSRPDFNKFKGLRTSVSPCFLGAKSTGDLYAAKMTQQPSIYPCPSCGFLVFSEPPGSYEICGLCGWEDDHVQLRHPGMQGGANGSSLREYQQDALRDYPLGVTEADGHARDSAWRPLRDNECTEPKRPSGGSIAYFNEALSDSPQYYWLAEPKQK